MSIYDFDCDTWSGCIDDCSICKLMGFEQASYLIEFSMNEAHEENYENPNSFYE